MDILTWKESRSRSLNFYLNLFTTSTALPHSIYRSPKSPSSSRSVKHDFGSFYYDWRSKMDTELHYTLGIVQEREIIQSKRNRSIVLLYCVYDFRYYVELWTLNPTITIFVVSWTPWDWTRWGLEWGTEDIERLQPRDLKLLGKIIMTHPPTPPPLHLGLS